MVVSPRPNSGDTWREERRGRGYSTYLGPCLQMLVSQSHQLKSMIAGKAARVEEDGGYRVSKGRGEGRVENRILNIFRAMFANSSISKSQLRSMEAWKAAATRSAKALAHAYTSFYMSCYIKGWIREGKHCFLELSGGLAWVGKWEIDLQYVEIYI